CAHLVSSARGLCWLACGCHWLAWGCRWLAWGGRRRLVVKRGGRYRRTTCGHRCSRGGHRDRAFPACCSTRDLGEPVVNGVRLDRGQVREQISHTVLAIDHHDSTPTDCLGVPRLNILFGMLLGEALGRRAQAVGGFAGRN